MRLRSSASISASWCSSPVVVVVVFSSSTSTRFSRITNIAHRIISIASSAGINASIATTSGIDIGAAEG